MNSEVTIVVCGLFRSRMQMG